MDKIGLVLKEAGMGFDDAVAVQARAHHGGRSQAGGHGANRSHLNGAPLGRIISRKP